MQIPHNKPKALLIGNGYFGQIMLPYIRKHCEIIGIATTSTTTLHALIKQADVCFIATPLHTHFTLAQMALQAGCHTFVEKPATTNAYEYDKLTTLAKERDRILFIDYIYTLSPSIHYALTLCQNNKLESIQATITQYGKFYENESVLEVLGVHYLSVFALMQERKMIHDIRIHNGAFVDSSRQSAILTLNAKQDDRSIHITLECSLLSHKRQRVLRLFSTSGCIQVDMLAPAPISYQAHKACQGVDSSPLPIFDEGGNLAHSLATFMGFIAHQNPAAHPPYALHQSLCKTTASLLDSALLYATARHL